MWSLYVFVLATSLTLSMGQGPFWDYADSSGMPQEGATCHFMEDRLVVFGGRSSFKTWISNPLRFYEGGVWREANPKGAGNVFRCFHTAVPHQGKLYIFGGRTGLFTIANDLLILDPKASTIQRVHDATGDPPSTRQAHASAIVGSQIYIHGGSPEPQLANALDDLYVYHIELNTWEFLGQGGGKRMGHQIVAYQEKLYLFGGVDAGGSYNVHDVSIYDIKSGRWTVASASLEPRCGHTATLVNDKVWIIAGRNEKGMLDDVVVWDLAYNRPIPVNIQGRLSPARQGHCASLSTAEEYPIYVYGGSESYSKYFDDLHRLYLQPASRITVHQIVEPEIRLPKVQPQAVATGNAAQGATFFAEKAKKIWTKVQSTPKNDLKGEEDLSDLRGQFADLLTWQWGIIPGDEAKAIKVNCEAFEASIAGEELARRKLEEETERLRELQKKVLSASNLHETREAEIAQLSVEARAWEIKLEDLDQKVKEADTQYASYEKNKEDLKETIAKFEAKGVSYQEQLDALGKALRLAQATLKSREEQHNAALAKKQTQATLITQLEGKIEAKMEEIADIKLRIRDAEASESDLDQRRMTASTDAFEDKNQIQRIQKLLQEQRQLDPKIQEAQRVQRTAEELAHSWISRVKAIGEVVVQSEEVNDCSRTGAPCRPAMEEYTKQLQDMLAYHEAQLRAKEEAKAEVEKQLLAVINRRDAFEKQLNVLEADLTELQRQLRNLQHDQVYENRIWPKVDAAWRDAKGEVDRLEKDSVDLQDAISKNTDDLVSKRAELQQEERTFSNYADTHERLTKERHSALLQYERALEALDAKWEGLEKSRKERRDLRRRSEDAIRDWKSSFSHHFRHANTCDNLRNQLCDSSLPCKTQEEEISRLKNELALAKKDMEALAKQAGENAKKAADMAKKAAESEGLKTAMEKQRQELDAMIQENARLKAEEASRKSA